MKYGLIIGLLLIGAAAGLFFWQRGKLAPPTGNNNSQPPPRPANPSSLDPGSPSSLATAGDRASANSFISPSGTCPQGYRTSYNTMQCVSAPCPAQTICTKDALLLAMGGFTGKKYRYFN